YGESHEIRSELVHLARGNAARRYGTDFAGTATVLVGDTPLDVAAARATGARVVAVATGGARAGQLAAAPARAGAAPPPPPPPPPPCSPQSSQYLDRGTHHPGLRLSRTGHPQQRSVHDGCPQDDPVQHRPGHPTATVRVVALNLPGTCQELLELQHGVIARWQMAQAGWSVRIVDPQLHSGRWQPLYRGVYATFTGRPSRTAFLWAAVLRAGPGAALSFDTAAELDR